MSSRNLATEYAQHTAGADNVCLMMDLVNTEALQQVVAKAFEQGRAEERRQLSAATRDRAELKQRLVDRLHRGGFGTYTYESVEVEDVAEDMLDELGL
ncbi:MULTISPECIES: hypothetical protein [Brachybacterium]|uniref:Uncharacterized protein n=1 Tax=Brachybacterium kimchii TaxID=2942909 RepID=A0ABY4N7P2_9MICO|nr:MULTISPECIES: hypothetical protein [Brachybacterium]MCG7309726.1 hypothetical protein [Brachybacterium sp. ACRRE]UQN30573.1 hypothetical protein M4486_04470 [Brachybacterium kimchii]